MFFSYVTGYLITNRTEEEKEKNISNRIIYYYTSPRSNKTKTIREM